MGYGGKQASRSGDVRRFNFTGNGSNTAFDLGFTPATQNQLIVTVNGLVQHYDAFSISGSTINFTGTPASGDTIQVTAVVDAVGVAAIPDGAIANVSSLAVSGAATFANSVAVTGNTTFSNTTAHTGAATFSSTVAVTGNISTTSQLLANGDIRGITTTNPTIWIANSAALTDGSMYMQFNTSSSEGRLGSYTNHPLVLMTNNGRRVIIDDSGRVTIPNQPSFKVFITGGNPTFSSSGENIIPYNASQYDTTSSFNTSTGRYTIPVTGKYMFVIQYNPFNINAGNWSRINFKKNGSVVLYGHQNYVDFEAGDHSYSVVVIENATAGDYYQVYSTSNDTSYGLSEGVQWNHFSGHLLG